MSVVDPKNLQGDHDSWVINARVGETPQVSNPLYQQLLDSNPYRSKDLTYNRSPWQQFLSWIGFRTKADAWEESVQENALQYDAGIYQQMAQDQYNSETAKAQRMREAGENPDLLGTGNVSEMSSPFQDPEGIKLGDSEEGVIGQIGSSIMGAFNTALGMASQFMQLQGMKEDVQGKGIANASSMMKLIGERVLGMTPAEGFQDDQSFKNWKHDVEMTLRTNYGRSFFKGSALRRWNRSLDDFVGGLPQSRDQFKAWQERLGSAKDYYYGREDHWSEAIDVFKIVNEELFGLRKAITENKAVAEHTKSEVDVQTATNELQYQEDLLPGERARAENETNRRRAEGETFEGILNTHLNKLGQRLDNLSKQGGLKGLIGEVILLLMTMKFNTHVDKNGNMSFGIAPPQAQ